MSEVILGRFARPQKGAFMWALLYLRPFPQLTFFFPNPISEKIVNPDAH